MKKAFTLIELLVVIAIIAILAAILFPVFARAKTAAKKAVVVSNVKQVSMALFMYQSDYDDMYMRGRSCVPYSSLNPKFKDPSYNTAPLSGCGSGGFYNSMDHYEWQKYLMPYTKSIDVFTQPLRERDKTKWDNGGELHNNIVLNLGFTGIKSTGFNNTTVSSFGDIMPFTGGNQSGIPNVSEAALFFDNVPLSVASFVPVLDKLEGSQTSTDTLTGYPLAYREFWAFRLLQLTTAQCAQNPQPNAEADLGKAPAGGITVGRADGSAKFFTAGAFVAKCPPMSAMLSGGTATSPTCTAGTLSQGYAYSGTVDTNAGYPMWGLGQ